MMHTSATQRYNLERSDGTVSGFTLIELLVVIAIVSGLTAIAVPQYARYRARAFDLRALQDLRNGALAQEMYFSETEHYLTCAQEDCQNLPGIARLSEGVQLQFESTENEFQGAASHPQGTGVTYEWDSARGGLVETR